MPTMGGFVGGDGALAWKMIKAVVTRIPRSNVGQNGVGLGGGLVFGCSSGMFMMLLSSITRYTPPKKDYFKNFFQTNQRPNVHDIRLAEYLILMHSVNQQDCKFE